VHLVDLFSRPGKREHHGQAGEFVDREGVYPPVPGADKIQFIEMDDLGEKVYAEKRKKFHKLFLQ
jgi:hypothetical protein